MPEQMYGPDEVDQITRSYERQLDRMQEQYEAKLEQARVDCLEREAEAFQRGVDAGREDMG